MQARFTNNPYYLEYESLLKDLHRLIADGKGDTEEADVVRDRMDTPEQRLNREEIDRLNGLSADLYMLQGDEVFEKYEGTQEQLRAELSSAWANRDWVLLLALLRKGPAHIPQEGIASLRAQAYEELGHTDTARRFIEYAARLNPDEASYRIRELHLLILSNHLSEALQSAVAYINNKDTPADLLISSVHVMQHCAENSPKQAIDLYEQAIAVLRRVMSDEQLFQALAPGGRVFALMIMGDCCKKLERWSEALAAYDKAIQGEPDNSQALTARGLLRAKLNLPNAISDFQQAVANNTSLLLPYLNIARYALLSRDFENAVVMCDRVLGLTQEPRALAIALDMKAIALSEQGEAADLVIATFARAASLDPLDEFIQHNYKIARETGLEPAMRNFQPPTEKALCFYDKAA